MTTTVLQRVKQTATDLQPYAEDVLNEIVEAAESIGQTTRERRGSQNVVSRVTSARPSRPSFSRQHRSETPLSDYQAKLIDVTRDSITKAADSISDSVDVKHLASELARGIVQVQNEAKRFEHPSPSRRLTSAKEHARASSAKKKDASVAVSKDFAGFVGWTSVAGVIVYKGLMNSERQEMTRRAVQSSVSSARGLVRRLRGDTT